MILSEFIRVMDLGWPDFLWGAGWIIAVVSTISVVIFTSGWGCGIDFYKKNSLPKLNRDQKEEIKELKQKLRTVEIDRDLFKGKFMSAKKELGVL